MEKDGVEEAFDRFSNLPVPIIHRIMSFLPTTKDVTRVAVLSKTLNSVCHSYPILDFDQRSWKKIMGFDSFLDFMQKSLQHCRESNIDIEIFKLCVIDHDGKSDQRIDESICFAIEHNVKELDLRFGDYWIRSRYKVYGQLYTLPKTITTKSIVVLNLVGLAFKFEDLIPSLNLVEHLSIELCSVSSNFTISSSKLKTLELQNCKGLKTIVVDAVNLQYFSHSTFTGSSEISLGDCKSLKYVKLDNTAITDDWLKNHLSKLLLLETLILKSCKILGEIDICHQKLKHLALLNCDKLVKAKIEAPNLVSFYFYNKSRFPVITLQCSSQLYADLILFGISPTNDEQFMNFKNFLGSFGHCKSLSITLPDMELSLLEELRNGLRSPLLSIKHLRVQLFSSSRSLPELLDILLCLSPYLETMCITSKYKENFEELNLQFQNKTAGVEEDDSDFQWNSSWKHHLKKVIIYKFVANNDVQETVVNFFLENDMKAETISDLKGEKYLCSKIKQH